MVVDEEEFEAVVESRFNERLIEVAVAERVAELVALAEVQAKEKAVAEYVQQGNEFPPGTRVRLTGAYRIAGEPDEHGKHPNAEPSTHGMISTDAPPQQGTVVSHEPAVYPHVERRHRIELDFNQGFITCDFIDLEAFDG